MKRLLPLLSLLVLLAFHACKKQDPVVPHEDEDTTQVHNPVPPDSLLEDNMLFGNPSQAVASMAVPDNYLLVKKQYALSYSNTKGTPNWACWHLSSAWTGSEPRCDCFSPDFTLPGSFYLVAAGDYTGSGFDRGHLCPSADRNKTAADNAATFLMTNVVPQAPNMNQGLWAAMEDYCRALKDDGNELYIYAGGAGAGGTGSLGGVTATIAGGHVTVPAWCWKVAVVMPAGKDDLQRVDANTRVMTVCIPNTQTANANPWGAYRISVDSLEVITGYDFLSAVPAAVQALIEGNADTGPTQ